MKTKTQKTKVKFLVNLTDETNEVFAFFPTEKYSSEKDLFTSYSHVGQHSACYIEYANESRLATETEYESLLKELIDMDYDLEIIK